MASHTDISSTEYDEAFFAGIADGARRSAHVVVPRLLDLFSPRSVLDVGGGTGNWAAAFLAGGVRDILTIDGPWAHEAGLAVPPENFRAHDLSQPLHLERGFDLALCLEAAEHLPGSAAADLVRTLTEAAPVVVFSAAIPGQGGDGHINEQLPSYWADLFAQRGYACFQDLRRIFWHNTDVEVWYRQNMFCYVKKTDLSRWDGVLQNRVEPGDLTLDVAHPHLVARHKATADYLEARVRGIEKHLRGVEEDATRLRDELAQRQGELADCRRELQGILNSRAWRTWRAMSRPYYRLRGQLGAKPSSGRRG